MPVAEAATVALSRVIGSVVTGMVQNIGELTSNYELDDPAPVTLGFPISADRTDLRYIGNPRRMPAVALYEQVLLPALRSGQIPPADSEEAFEAEVRGLPLEEVRAWACDVLKENPWPPGFYLPSFQEFVTSDEYLGFTDGPTARQSAAINDSIGPDARAWFVEQRKVSCLCLVYGKGSGKDLVSSWVCAYVAWSVSHMRNPWFHFNHPTGEVLDIVNVAQDEDSARLVFFTKLRNAVLRDCFAGVLEDRKKDVQADTVFFKRPVPGERFSRLCVRINSMHSKNESVEGRNTFLYIMDEADAMRDSKGHGNATKMHNTLTTSNRFGSKQLGLVISYPRAQNGFIFEMLAKCGNRGGKTIEWWGDLAPTWRVLPWKTYRPVIIDGHERWTNDLGFVSNEPDSEMARIYRDDPELFRAMYACLSGETWVVDDGGLVRLKNAPNRIYKGKKNAIRITTKYGYTLEGTADHSILDAEGEWRALGGFAIGDKVGISQAPNKFGINAADVRLSELAGQYVGDGCLIHADRKKPSVNWVYDPKDADVAMRHFMFLRELGENPCLTSAPSTLQLRLRSRDAWERYCLLFGDPCYSYEKSVPDWVMSGTKEVVAAFLRGLFEADGTISTRGIVQFTSTSKQLIQQVQALLGLFGITAQAIRKGPNAGFGNFTRPAWTLQLSQRRTLKFWADIGFLSERKKSRCHRVNPEHGGRFASDEELYADTIVAVEDIGEIDVFDLFDRPDHRFFANGFIAHNCEPPAAEGAFFSMPKKIDECIILYNEPAALVEQTIREDIDPTTGMRYSYVGLSIRNLRFRKGVVYFLGGDAGETEDSFALAISHLVPSSELGFCSELSWANPKYRYQKHYKPQALPVDDKNWKPEMWRCEYTGEIPVPGKHQYWGVCSPAGRHIQRPIQVGETEDGEPIYKEDHTGAIVYDNIHMPQVVEDLLLEWVPNRSKGMTVDYRNVRDIILQIGAVCQLGMCFFDRWNATSLIQDIRAAGIGAENKAFGSAAQLEWYRHYKMLVYNNIVELLPGEDKARRQLRELQLINGNKIDHPPLGAKDLTDAEALSFWLCCDQKYAPGRIDYGGGPEGTIMDIQAAGAVKRVAQGQSIVNAALGGTILGR